MKFLLVCSQGSPETTGNLGEFRIPELNSIAALFGFEINYPDPIDTTRPYMVIELAGEKEARLLGSRAISVKHIWEYWADARTYDDLHTIIKPRNDLYDPYTGPSTTWKFTVSGFARNINLVDQVAVINSFRYLGFQGDIKLKNPQCEVGVFEEYVRRTDKEKGRELNDMRWVWMGRKICDTKRNMIDVFDLKKRAYIGTTSMEAEVSLLMANQALAAPGKLIYDPFAGTGSMLLTSAAFGALTMGSDIDGRQMRGKKTNIGDSAAQYGIKDKIVDCVVFDVTQHPYRRGEIFDAIVTDPPYGVRAGAKRLGRKEKNGQPYVPKPVPGYENVYSHELPDYVPATLPWEMTEVIESLITYALFLLRPGGRLVFFLPTDNLHYSDIDIPVIPGMTLISNSSQDYGKWARRLITMEKSRSVSVEEEKGVEGLEGLDRGIRRLVLGESGGSGTSTPKEEGEKRPGHAGFRDRYFAHFEDPEAAVKSD
ncbi:hypothetical protein MNV49_002361 [Pseudohyphozyma bogoriensis]|nr:hypothetical protein MNV49_002361 [Pseudohyphozyma bogoriensis]